MAQCCFLLSESNKVHTDFIPESLLAGTQENVFQDDGNPSEGSLDGRPPLKIVLHSSPVKVLYSIRKSLSLAHCTLCLIISSFTTLYLSC